MAELVDALASGVSGCKAMRVRISPAAQVKIKNYKISIYENKYQYKNFTPRGKRTYEPRTRRSFFARPVKPVVKIEAKGIKLDSELTVKFAALGGLEEIGRNMMFLNTATKLSLLTPVCSFPKKQRQA